MDALSHFERFAVYYVPSHGPLREFGARWLGWDMVSGTEHLLMPTHASITETPRRYGFHATIKPPFRLCEGHDAVGMLQVAEAVARRLPPVTLERLEPAQLGRFLALIPAGETGSLQQIAATVVQELDQFRAPLRAEELARRRKASLSPLEEDMLLRWGYPYVMEAFRFHMTLTGRLSKPELRAARVALEQALPPLPAPFVISELALVGERADGRFQMIRSLPLRG